MTSPRRLIGPIVGLGGIGLVLRTRIRGEAPTDMVWLASAMLIPLMLAVEGLVMGRGPAERPA